MPNVMVFYQIDLCKFKLILDFWSKNLIILILVVKILHKQCNDVWPFSSWQLILALLFDYNFTVSTDKRQQLDDRW